MSRGRPPIRLIRRLPAAISHHNFFFTHLAPERSPSLPRRVGSAGTCTFKGRPRSAPWGLGRARPSRRIPGGQGATRTNAGGTGRRGGALQSKALRRGTLSKGS